MENQFTPGVERRPRKGLAVASLVLGILSIPTLGLVLVGGVVGIILGVIALRRANRDPVAYGGRGLAIAGIATCCISFLVTGLIGIGAAVAIPNLLKSQQVVHEISALSAVKEIGQAQVLYSVTKGRGKFTDLRTLAAAGLIDPLLGSGQKGGYYFIGIPVYGRDVPPMFDTTAYPVESGSFGTGNRSFYSNETMVIWEAEGPDPPTASPSDRTPKSGSPIAGYANPERLAPTMRRN